MRYTYFHIKNYKGIRDVHLDLDPTPGVYTLVGLNESGKTTLLEAINSISRTDRGSPSGDGVAGADPRDLIPLRQSADFTGTIEIKAGIELTVEDRAALVNACNVPSKSNIVIGNEFQRVRRFIFDRGEFTKEDSGLVCDFYRTTPKRRTLLEKEQRQPAINEAFARLPQVLYFPNFLVSIPDKIYVEAASNLPQPTRAIHTYYAQLFDDIFRAVGFDLTTEVLNRLASSDERSQRQADAIMRRVEQNMTNEIIKGWQEVLRQSEGPGDVIMESGTDQIGRFFRILLRKGIDTYQIVERSLGFRWYFAFVLLTHYRLFRKEQRQVIYLFDEPASNLHSAAQQRLLESLSDRRKQGGTIIYTTHSHHMIKPEWLEGAYVVQNTGLSYDTEDDSMAGATNITLTRYRNYVHKGTPNTTHIQPILEALDYQPSGLEFQPKSVLVEGKNDYYSLLYSALLLGEQGLAIIPGTSASALDPVVRIYVGWGWPFLVVHDGDQEGMRQIKRMREAFDMVPSDYFVLLPELAGDQEVKAFESLFEPNDRLLIQKATGQSDIKYEKKVFNQSIRELVAAGQVVQASEETKTRLRRVLRGLHERLAALK